MEQYYIVRSGAAGVFFGKIKERNDSEVIMADARCLWYWAGAATLLQMAVEGVKRPENCKFTIYVPEITILGVVEIIPCSSAAIESIKGVPEWKV